MPGRLANARARAVAGSWRWNRTRSGTRRPAVERGDPGRVEPARDLPRDPCPGVPIGEDHISALQRPRISRDTRSAASDAARSAATRGVKSRRPRAALATLATRRDGSHLTRWTRRPSRSSHRPSASRPDDLPDPSSPSAAIRRPVRRRDELGGIASMLAPCPRAGSADDARTFKREPGVVPGFRSRARADARPECVSRRRPRTSRPP